MTAESVADDACTHLRVTVPGIARRDWRLHDTPVYGWCQDCRAEVDDAHIRKLRPDRVPGACIWWVAESDEFPEELTAIRAAAAKFAPPMQLALF